MRSKVIALSLILLPALAMAKNKKPQVPAVFASATFVYVESENGDEMKPGLYPADRQAIEDVRDALRDWKRYKLTLDRDHADLMFVVRKGRLANGGIRGNVGSPQSLPPNQAPGHGSTGGGAGVGTEVEVGPEEDMLRVYQLTADGKRLGPIWDRSQPDGLDAPQLFLFRQLKDAVESAYPANAAPANPSSQPSKP